MLVNPTLAKGSVEFLILSLLADGSEALDRQRVEWRVFTAAVNLIVEPNGS